MGKREYDRMKHSGRKNRHDVTKDYTKGGKGWGDAMTDHNQSYAEEWGNDHEEGNILVQHNDDYFKPEDPAKPVAVNEQLIARMLADDGPFKKDDCVALYEYTVEDGEFNFHFKNTEGEDFWMLAKGEGSEYVWYDPETKQKTEAPKLRIIPIRSPRKHRQQRRRPAPVQRSQGVSGWSVGQVKTWVASVGEIFKEAADEFENCLVDGDCLMEVTFDDLKETIGGGLSTRKLFVEIKKLKIRERIC